MIVIVMVIVIVTAVAIAVAIAIAIAIAIVIAHDTSLDSPRTVVCSRGDVGSYHQVLLRCPSHNSRGSACTRSQRLSARKVLEKLLGANQ